jgi:hypothetical protein
MNVELKRILSSTKSKYIFLEEKTTQVGNFQPCFKVMQNIQKLVIALKTLNLLQKVVHFEKPLALEILQYPVRVIPMKKKTTISYLR